MRRDPALMRQLLIDVEAMPRMVITEPARQHVALLADAGYLEGIDGSTFQRRAFRATGLTWKGHELLDAIRTEAQWAAVLARLGPDGAPFDILARVAYQVSAEAAGLPVEAISEIAAPSAGDREQDQRTR